MDSNLTAGTVDFCGVQKSQDIPRSSNNFRIKVVLHKTNCIISISDPYLEISLVQCHTAGARRASPKQEQLPPGSVVFGSWFRDDDEKEGRV